MFIYAAYRDVSDQILQPATRTRRLALLLVVALAVAEPERTVYLFQVLVRALR